MNRNNWLCVFTGSILAITIALGSIGCLQSAFDLPVANPAALWCLVAGITVLFGHMLQRKHGGLAVFCLLLPAAGYLYWEGTAVLQFLQLVQHISQVYDRAYHWGMLQLINTSDAGAYDLPLGIWAVLITLFTVRSVCCQKRVWLTILTVLIPMFACVVVTDTVPGEIHLLILLTGLILLILTDAVRRENRMQGIRLIFFAAIPVTLGLLLLFLAIPQNTYVNQTAVLQENLHTALEHIPQLMDDGLAQAAATLRGIPSQEVNLANLGERIPFTYPVMEVTADTGGTLYLRGQDYSQYDGLHWTISKDREEPFFRSGTPQQAITIRTQHTKQFRYLPYYPAEETLLAGGMAENPIPETEYTISRVSLPEDWRRTAYFSAADHAPGHLQAYLSLPETTRQAARAFLEQKYPDSVSNTAKADIIAALVTDSAAYSLQPEKMPESEPDFVLWFLQEADSGYCIHFATAAAVLLRAADVPARYVTGYMVDAVAGETVTVTEEDAHAWAEYYEPNLSCWIPLEATPAEETIPTAPAESMGQTQATQAPTDPVETEGTDAAEAPTVPSSDVQTPEVPVPSEEAGGFHLLTLLLIPVFLVILAAQRSLRLELRRRRYRRGTTNQQALQRWREAERLARLLKETPAEELIELAQKAKYSQHELTAEELLMFDSYCRSCLRRLKEKPLYLRFLYQYFYAAY